jgi:DNA-binding transcriptional ArsR family regulator
MGDDRPKPPRSTVKTARAAPVAETAIALFRALGDPVRMRILRELAGGPRNVTQLCDRLHLVQPSASHHLAALRGCRLITRRRDGIYVYYQLSKGSQFEARDGSLSIDLACDAGHMRLRVSGSWGLDD